MSPGRGGWPRRQNGACSECGSWAPLHKYGVHLLCRACYNKILEREEAE